MPDYSSLHIGVFASLKRGFEHFIYRELTILEKNGAAISVYPTKVGAGLYGPRPTWNFHPWTVLAVCSPTWSLRLPAPPSTSHCCSNRYECRLW
ncbi:MAG: hypothetical protein R3C56_38130 [Pirellulaceae bacterium]